MHAITIFRKNKTNKKNLKKDHVLLEMALG